MPLTFEKPKIGTPAPFDLLRFFRRRARTPGNVLRATNAAIVWDANAGTARWRIVARFLPWVYRLPLDIGRAVLSYGRTARAKFGRGYVGQVGDLLRLWIRNGARPYHYYHWGLARHHGGEALFECASPLVGLNIRDAIRIDALAPVPSKIDDKIISEHHCRAHGIPHSETLVVASAEGPTTIDGAPWTDRLPASDLFIKPSRSGQGRNARLLRVEGDNRFRDSSDQVLAGEEMLERLCDEAGKANIHLLVQRRLFNHPELVARVGQTLATTRMVTIKTPSGEPVVGTGFFRCARRADVAVDNYHAGGILFEYDADNGTVFPGITHGLEHDGELHMTSPLTGARIAGEKVLGNDVMAAGACRAHATTEGYFSVAWDMAHTPDGPVIVEAHFRGMMLMGGFFATRYARVLAEHAANWLAENQPARSRFIAGADR